MTTEFQPPANVIANFDLWQGPKFGRNNPENQTNDVWSWLIRSRATPQAAHEAAGHGEKSSPGWCFDRVGQTETVLPDGSSLYIGGEHEDFYDPDFFIYNDVVVLKADGSVAIFGYPVDVFPPTDFHSATLYENTVIIIGGLRHPEDRNHDDTFVYRLQLSDFSIHRIETFGTAPSWLYEHSATLDKDRQRIVCSGGLVTHIPTGRTVENLTTWAFDLSTSTWSQIATQPFQRWVLVREDEGWNDLWQIEELARANRTNRKDQFTDQFLADLAERNRVVDTKRFAARFTPPMPHTPIIADDPFGEEHRVHRLSIEGVVVRIVEDMHEVAVTVEGSLPSSVLAELERFGVETYSAIEGVPYKSIRL